MLCVTDLKIAAVRIGDGRLLKKIAETGASPISPVACIFLDVSVGVVSRSNYSDAYDSLEIKRE